MDMQRFDAQMGDQGWFLFPELVPTALLESLRRDIPRHIDRCRALQARNGLEAGTAGAAHHVLGERDSLDEFASRLFLDEHMRRYFGGEYIVNSFGAIDNRSSGQGTYAHGARFHRDVRTYAGELRLMLNMLVMVDEFTEANGATRLVPGSHRVEARPSDAELAQRAIYALGPAGSILLFDSNVWHCASTNTTNAPRRALTLTFTRPFVKQQMDYPRLLGEHFTDDPRFRQWLGYNARVPCSHEEWYQPPERRMYRPGQG